MLKIKQKLTNIILLCSFLILITGCVKSQVPLKTTRYGRLQMLTDVGKERIISAIKFNHQNNVQDVDVVRLDFVAPNCLPLVISSEEVTPSDSLGLLVIMLPKASLTTLMELIHNSNSKVNNRKVDYILLRITYRWKGEVFQYYQTNELIVTAYLRSIFEQQLKKINNQAALASFYDFVRPAQLEDFNKPLRD